MLDPSTNANPLAGGDEHPDEMNDTPNWQNDTEKKRKKRANDVSKHTFYIENSQTRLKLFARNEVLPSLSSDFIKLIYLI
jgi:phospholipase D1/2